VGTRTAPPRLAMDSPRSLRKRTHMAAAAMDRRTLMEEEE
jgi:hypothetical protein